MVALLYTLLGVEYYSTPQVKTEQYWTTFSIIHDYTHDPQILKNTKTQVLNDIEFCSVQ
jgi:hypothetical protein